MKRCMSGALIQPRGSAAHAKSAVFVIPAAGFGIRARSSPAPAALVNFRITLPEPSSTSSVMSPAGALATVIVDHRASQWILHCRTSAQSSTAPLRRADGFSRLEQNACADAAWSLN